MRSSLEIAQEATLRPIAESRQTPASSEDELEQYGRYKAKVDLSILDRLADRPDGKIVNVTAITPTPAGEGKTTTSVSLTQGLGALGRKAVLAIREASLGPVFGVKGGAAGGGYAQVVPMEDLNLHLTGDLHAITAANNLLAALIDAHLLHGNELRIDPLSISWRRCMDMNDRSLRDIVTGLGGRVNGYPRQTGFDITAASEIMGARRRRPRPRRPPRAPRAHHDRADVRGRAGDGGGPQGGRLDGRAPEGGPQAEPRADARRAAGLRPLRAVREHRPRQQLARRRPGRAQARRLPRHRVRASASDMGMEKFFDITCRIGGLRPSAVVVVATVRALKHHGGNIKGGMAEIEGGAANLARHIGIVKHFGLNAVVGVNKFPTDTPEELELVRRLAVQHGAYAAEINTAFEHGGKGATALAEAVVAAADEPNDFRLAYPYDAPIEEKIRAIAQNVYGADDVFLLKAAKRQGGGVRGGRPRAPADLHGEDAPLALARPDASQRADRLHGDGARPPALHGRGLDRRALRRHADDARPRQGPAAFSIDIDERRQHRGLF